LEPVIFCNVYTFIYYKYCLCKIFFIFRYCRSLTINHFCIIISMGFFNYGIIIHVCTLFRAFIDTFFSYVREKCILFYSLLHLFINLKLYNHLNEYNYSIIKLQTRIRLNNIKYKLYNNLFITKLSYNII